MKKVVYHLHIPKTAGTTLRSQFSQQYTNQRTYPALVWNDIWKLHEKPPLFLHKHLNVYKYDFVSGHFGYKIVDIFPLGSLSRFTMLRNPRERALSFYFHILSNTQTAFYITDRHGKYWHYSRPFLTLEETLKHDVYSNMFNNIQTRYLGLDYNPWEIRDKQKKSGISMDPDYCYDFIGRPISHSIFETAKARLDSMYFGLQEYYLVSCYLLSRQLDVEFDFNNHERLMDYGRNKKSQRVSKDAIVRLDNLNYFDKKLYTIACDLFFNRVLELADSLSLERPSSLDDLKNDSEFTGRLLGCNYQT